ATGLFPLPVAARRGRLPHAAANAVVRFRRRPELRSEGVSRSFAGGAPERAPANVNCHAVASCVAKPTMRVECHGLLVYREKTYPEGLRRTAECAGNAIPSCHPA